MRRAITRGTGLTRHLLAFSRRSPVNPESIALGEHLSGMRQMFDSSLGGHILVEMVFAEELWPVEVDTGELELALLNLCVNARDAMADGGTITIRAENVAEHDAGRPKEFVKLSVTDTGSGMPEHVLARVFEPFFTTKDVNKGSGLGLPQVYGFAQQSGGRVSIESKVGEGTVVTVFLPRAARLPEAAADTEDMHAAPALQGDGARRGAGSRAGMGADLRDPPPWIFYLQTMSPSSMARPISAPAPAPMIVPRTFDSPGAMIVPRMPPDMAPTINPVVPLSRSQ
jgi:hypothetical protein